MKQILDVSYNKSQFKKFNNLKQNPKSTREEPPQATKHKTELEKLCTSAVQVADNANSNPSILHKPWNSAIENRPQTFLNKLKTFDERKIESQSLGKS